MFDLSVQTLVREEMEKSLELTGWSGNELSRRAGLSPGVVNRLISKGNKTAPTLSTMAKIRAAVDRYCVEAAHSEQLNQPLWNEIRKIRASFGAIPNEM